MTLRLILTRHAKSSWDDPLMSDHDRPLNRRGRESAAAIGTWLAQERYIPDAALVSTAERTRETWDVISKTAGFTIAPEYSPALYLSEPDVMLGILKGAVGQTVMMIAHNPGSSYFAQSILAEPSTSSLFDRYPTGATTIVEFDAEAWDQVIWRSGRMVDFVVPRDLMTEDA